MEEIRTKIKGKILRKTVSVCPVCLKRISADLIQEQDRVYMEKTCREHGDFKTLIWEGLPDYEGWRNQKVPSAPVQPASQTEKGCPYDCGLCPQHRQHTCCVLLEVTNRCNLHCPVCFARAGEGTAVKEPSLEEIGTWYDAMMNCGGPFNIQLSGGEPTMREDLEEVIRLGKQKGFTFFQLNTNGIRLGEDPAYIQKLRLAGLNCVFLQFDGLREETNRILRGKPLLEIKKRAIENCRKAGVGVVLVPVIAKGVNDDEVGEILKFAWEQMPAVRGVHFQPVSYFGRYEDRKTADRFTLSHLLQAIEAQTQGRMKMADFKAAGAENAYCSFSGNFMKAEDGSVRPWHDPSSCGCGSPTAPEPLPVAGVAAKQAQKFVAKRWSAPLTLAPKPTTSCCCEPAPKAADSCCCDTSSLDRFLARLDTYTLAVSAMAFMDAWNLDLDRLKDCYIHVVARKGNVKLIPFCAYNLTATDGTTLYRELPS